MTLPRSSGWTRTSRTLPRRIARVETWTSSGFSTMPLTRCSSASSSMSGLAARLTALGRARAGRIGRSRCVRRSGRSRSRAAVGGAGRRLLRGGLGLGPAGLRLDVRVRLGLSLGVARLGVGGLGVRRLGVGLPGPAATPGRGRPGVAGVLARVLQGGGERLLLVRLRLADPQGALGTRLTLELLPVARDLEDVHHRRGGLGAHGQPVLSPLRVDLDERRLFLRVVLADLFDGTPVALGTGVGHDDPVGRHPGTAQALELDLYSHGCGLLPANYGAGGDPAARWGLGGITQMARRAGVEGPASPVSERHSARKK